MAQCGPPRPYPWDWQVALVQAPKMLKEFMAKTGRTTRISLNSQPPDLVIQTVSPWLLSHFGWCAAEVGEMAASSYCFRQSLLQLTRRQFHLIALSLALLRQSLTSPNVGVSELGELLASVPGKEVIARIYGRTPKGVLGTLAKLPDHMLRPGAYINLINLLEEPRAAKVLFYTDNISSNTIGLLMRLDPALRKSRLIDLLRVPRAAAITEFLVEAVLRIRSDVSREAVIGSLGSVGTAEGLEKWFCNWIEKGGFPSPPWDGNELCVPLRTVREMNETARLMKNCLRAKVVSVISGMNYYYLRRSEPLTVVELFNDRLAGWIVSDMKGMENGRVSMNLTSRIRDEFKSGGVGVMPSFDGIPRGLNPLYWLGPDFHWPHV